MDESKLQGLLDRERPKKTWGWEEWIVNNDLYCGKRLHFDVAFGSTSLHFHVRKHETMYVERGEFLVVMVGTEKGTRAEHRMIAGDSIVIEPNTPHRIIALTAGSVMVEFSTHHEDSDSYRIDP
jgi:mannose-6-phosphate isomerase-like protein (cupin superfamily)